MVKVPKPVPKSLSKAGKTDAVIKKKKSLVQKVKKPEIATPAKNSKKAKLIEETVQVQSKKGGEKKLKKTEQKQQETEKKAKSKAPKLQQQQSENAKQTPSLKGQQNKKKKSKAASAEIDAENATLKNAKKPKKPTADTAAAPTDKKAKQSKKDNAVAVAGPISNSHKKKVAKLAFKKEQNIKNKDKTTKSAEVKYKQKYESVPFDEDKFKTIVNAKNVRQVAKALKEQVETELKSAKTKKIFSDYRYFLNVTAFKIANCPKRMVKLNLKHSLVGKDDSTVFIVTDLQRGAKADYEPTVQHYEDLLLEAGVEGVKVMPFNQLRNECNTFEAVRKLSQTYDYFLCDGRLAGHIVGFCGKIFQKPRTTFHSVHMNNTKNLKNEIAKAMRRTAYKQVQKGDLISIPVGNHSFTEAQLSENIMHVVSQLDAVYAGGLANIRSMHVKIDIVGTSALPIYMSMGLPPPETPSVIGPREQRLMKMKREANAVLTKFGLTKEGKIVKLDKEEIDRKLKLKRNRAALLEEKPTDDADEDDDDEDDDDEEITGKAPVDNDGDESAIPAKKPRKEETSKVDGDVKKKNVEEAKADEEKDSDDDKADEEEAEENGEDDDADDDDDEDLDELEYEEEDDDDEDVEEDDDDDGADEDEDDDDDEAADDDENDGDGGDDDEA